MGGDKSHTSRLQENLIEVGAKGGFEFEHVVRKSVTQSAQMRGADKEVGRGVSGGSGDRGHAVALRGIVSYRRRVKKKKKKKN